VSEVRGDDGRSFHLRSSTSGLLGMASFLLATFEAKRTEGSVMEEVDLTLVASQKKAVMVLRQAQGFDPAAFEWQVATQDEDGRDYAVTFRNAVSVLVLS